MKKSINIFLSPFLSNQSQKHMEKPHNIERTWHDVTACMNILLKYPQHKIQSPSSEGSKICCFVQGFSQSPNEEEKILFAHIRPRPQHGAHFVCVSAFEFFPHIHLCWCKLVYVWDGKSSVTSSSIASRCACVRYRRHTSWGEWNLPNTN